MKSWIKKEARRLKKEDLDVYTLAILDFFLILGVIIGKNPFLHSVFILIILIASTSLLVTIVLTKAEQFKNNPARKKLVTYSITIKILFLFSLPRLLVFIFNHQLLQIVAVSLIIYYALRYSYRAFERELAPLLSFLNVVRLKLSSIAFARLQSLRIKIYRNKPTSVPPVLLAKKGSASLIK